MRSNIMNRISFGALFFFAVLLPVFFLPFVNISLETSKGLFLVIGIIVSVVVWVMARFFDGKISLPRSLCMLSGAGVVLVTFLSAMFSSSPSVSLFGTMFDIGTFWFILGGFLLMFMSSILFREPKYARTLLFGVVFSSAIVLVFQGLHILLPKTLALGVLLSKTDNIIGSWNTFGIFAGFYAVASLFIIEFLPVIRQIKFLLAILLAFSLLLVATVNFIFVWGILGIFALLIFIYKISIHAREDREEGAKINFPFFSFVVVILSLFFFMSAGLVGGFLPGKLGISHSESGPTLASTVSITKAVISDHPVLGIGPNRFAEAWAFHKPVALNTTQFWNDAFVFGSGLLPTFTATTGILGVLAWAIFLLSFAAAGIRSLFYGARNAVTLEMVLFFFLSLYLFVSSFFYVTGTVVFMLSMIFAGTFLGLVSHGRQKKELSLSFYNDHRKSFFFMLFLIIMMMVSIALGFKYVERFASVLFFTKTLSTNSIPEAESSIRKALALYSNDLYLRTYAQVHLTKLDSLSVAKSETDKALLQSALDQAVNGAEGAVAYNSKNYLNFEMLGVVFQTAGLLGVKEAYGRAIDAYEKASELNPANPRFKLVLANVAFADGKIKEAKDYVNKALVLKPDYIDALITLSKIAQNEGNKSDALSYAEKALLILPTNQNLIKYTESLRNSSGENF